MPGPAQTAPKARRTQAERSAATRTALLEATIDCLVEFGYAGVTTVRVVERAGVSRGAQVHHFPSKSMLVVEAMRHLADKRSVALDEAVSGSQRVDVVLDALWREHAGPLFEASMELWVAARTDAELAEQLRPIDVLVLARAHEETERAFGRAARSRAFKDDFETTLACMRGLAQLLMVTEDRRTVERRWSRSRGPLADLLRRHL